MHIDINDEHNMLNKAQVDLLQKLLKFAAKREDISNNTEVSLSIVTNTEIQTLNKTYRDKDIPTDVLSFPMDDIPEQALLNMPSMLGDIIISFDKVMEQKASYNHSFERELAFLTIHGLLHLLGYTHDHPTEEKEMFDKQKLILKEFGLER